MCNTNITCHYIFCTILFLTKYTFLICWNIQAYITFIPIKMSTSTLKIKYMNYSVYKMHCDFIVIFIFWLKNKWVLDIMKKHVHYYKQSNNFAIFRTHEYKTSTCIYKQVPNKIINWNTDKYSTNRCFRSPPPLYCVATLTRHITDVKFYEIYSNSFKYNEKKKRVGVSKL